MKATIKMEVWVIKITTMDTFIKLQMQMFIDMMK